MIKGKFREGENTYDWKKNKNSIRYLKDKGEKIFQNVEQKRPRDKK